MQQADPSKSSAGLMAGLKKVLSFFKRRVIAITSLCFLIALCLVLGTVFFIARFTPQEQRAYGNETAAAPSSEKVIPPCIGENRFVIRNNGELYYQTNGYCVKAWGADTETFQILKDGFAKDKKSAFYEGNRMEGTDPETFEALGWLYAKDKNQVYRWRYNAAPHYLIVQSSDPATFVALDGWYGKDKNTGFYGWNAVPESEGLSFTAIASRDREKSAGDAQSAFAKDKRHVYFRDKIITGADPATFQLMPEMEREYVSFSRDANSVFRNEEIFSGAHPDSFTFLEEKDGCGAYYRDDQNVFNGSYMIKSADPATFKVIGPIFGGLYDQVCLSKDKNGVLSGTDRVPFLDPDTFMILGGYSKDKNGVYFNTGLTPVAGADPSSFETTSTSLIAKDRSWMYECGSRVVPNKSRSTPLGDYYGKLDSTVYHFGKAIDGADATTFQVLGGAGVINCESAVGGYAIDARRVYFAGKPIQGADPETFKLTNRVGYGRDVKAEYNQGVVVRNDFKICSSDVSLLPGGRNAWIGLVPQLNGATSSTLLEFCLMPDGGMIFSFKRQPDAETKTYQLFNSAKRSVGSVDLVCSGHDTVLPRSMEYLQGSRVRLACAARGACDGETFYDLDLNKIADDAGASISSVKDEYYDCGYRG